jgi:hypothetical protein
MMVMVMMMMMMMMRSKIRTRRQDDKTRQIGMEERYVAGVFRVAPGVVGG